MANNTTQANLGFEKQLWDAACVLWGSIPAAEYRQIIVGLIFLRYISAAFEKRYAELVAEGDGFEDDPDAYTEDNIFFVPEIARWKYIAKYTHSPKIGKVLDDAMRAIEDDNRTLKNVLPKVYASPDLDKKVLGEVVDLFTNNLHMDGSEEDQDLLGRTYEYCIAQFAAKEGKGGDILYIETMLTPGKGELILTGQLGDVMKESARIALSLVKSIFPEEAKKLADHDLHLHVPAGAVPKDGPSAGVMLTTAISSLLTGRVVDPHIAMTGEVALRGAVTPIGGLPEKLMAAQRAGITKVFIPQENLFDLKDVAQEVKDKIEIVPVSDIMEIMEATCVLEKQKLSA